MTLTDRARQLLDRPTYAVLATLNPDGSPQTTVMWVTRDGDDVLFSTIEGRAKPRNLRRDPRVSVMLVDPADPLAYVEIRGTAQVSDDGPVGLIHTLSEKYEGHPFRGDDGTDHVRLIVRVRPERLIAHGRAAHPPAAGTDD
jgi:PPOX class probable F420-dependent enzyme